MLLFEKKNLGFQDWLRMQQLEQQLGPTALEGGGDDQQKLGLLAEYHTILDKVVHADTPKPDPLYSRPGMPAPLARAGMPEPVTRGPVADTDFGFDRGGLLSDFIERMPTPTASSSSPAPSTTDDAGWRAQEMASFWPFGLELDEPGVGFSDDPE